MTLAGNRARDTYITLGLAHALTLDANFSVGTNAYSWEL